MKIFALCTTALAADAFSPVKESWKTGSAADGFQAHFDMTLDDNGFDGVAGLNVGLPTTSCNDAHPQCREFKQNREVVLSGANSPFGDDGPLAEISLVTTLTARTQQCNMYAFFPFHFPPPHFHFAPSTFSHLPVPCTA